VSKGIRRIVAHTGDAAKEVFAANEELEKLIDAAAGTPAEELLILIAEVQKLISSTPVGLRAKRKGQATVAELQSKFKAFEKSQKQASATSVDVGGVAGDLIAKADGKAIVAEVPGAGGDALNGIVDSVKKQSSSYAVLLGSVADGKVSFVAACSEDVIAKGLKAGDWIREAAKTAGGGGGGRPNHAQAGGKDPAKLGEALNVARAFAAKF
jgi:alanyl-tRNA synthetase